MADPEHLRVPQHNSALSSSHGEHVETVYRDAYDEGGPIAKGHYGRSIPRPRKVSSRHTYVVFQYLLKIRSAGMVHLCWRVQLAQPGTYHNLTRPTHSQLR